MNQRLEPSPGLSPRQLDDIRRLEERCNAFEGLTMKLNWSRLKNRPPDEINDFLFYAGDRLVGYLALYVFNPREAEVAVAVHPDYRRQGIFRRLLAAARQELQRRRTPDLLFICERPSASGAACMQALGAKYDFSEYKMNLIEAVEPSPAPAEFLLRPARPEDAPDLARMDELCFGNPAAETMKQLERELVDGDREFLVALQGAEKVGKVRISKGEGEVFITAFCVLPEHRRRGLGRAILTRTVAQLVAGHRQPISLEVATDNAHALSLYERCGFQTSTAYDYYRLPVDG